MFSDDESWTPIFVFAFYHFRIVNLWLMLFRILSHHPELDAAKQVSKNLFVDKHKESCASSKSLSVNLLKGVTKWVAPGQMQAR